MISGKYSGDDIWAIDGCVYMVQCNKKIWNLAVSGLVYYFLSGMVVTCYKVLGVDKVLQSVLRQYFHQHKNRYQFFRGLIFRIELFPYFPKRFTQLIAYRFIADS